MTKYLIATAFATLMMLSAASITHAEVMTRQDAIKRVATINTAIALCDFPRSTTAALIGYAERALQNVNLQISDPEVQDEMDHDLYRSKRIPSWMFSAICSSLYKIGQ